MLVYLYATDKDGKPKTKEVEKPWIINDVAPLWKKAPATHQKYCSL